MSDLISRKALLNNMFGGGYMGRWRKEDIEEIINAQPTAFNIEKQVSKKVKPSVNLNVAGVCPECFACQPFKLHDYCFHCGQKLDWSDSNE